jgi:chromosome segregation ATPase
LKRRVKELEKQLQDNLDSQTNAQAELEKVNNARGRAEVALRTELAAAKTVAQKAEAASQEKAKQYAQLQEELNTLRQAHDELEAHRTQQKQSTDDSQQRIQDLENRLRDSVAELGRAKAALEAQSVQRASEEPAGNSEELNRELLHLRESEAARGAELAELERRLHDNVATLARVTADFEKERGERRRVEQRASTLTVQLQELHGNLQQHLESDRSAQERTAQLEQQLQEREEIAARAGADLQKEATARQLAEQQLQTTGELITHLRNCVTSFDQAKGGFKRRQDELETRLQASRKELNEAEAKLQQELTERRRLEETLTTVRRNLQDQTESSAIELAKLKSEIQDHQFERQRLEGEAIQSRYASVDSARVGNSMVNSFRRRIRRPWMCSSSLPVVCSKPA